MQCLWGGPRDNFIPLMLCNVMQCARPKRRAFFLDQNVRVRGQVYTFHKKCISLESIVELFMI
jgi:hypothetical protein